MNSSSVNNDKQCTIMSSRAMLGGNKLKGEERFLRERDRGLDGGSSGLWWLGRGIERGMNRMERHPETQEECQWGRRQFRNRMGRITLSNFEAGKKEP